MGTCNCSLETSKEKLDEIQSSPPQKQAVNQPSESLVENEAGAQKRRVKVALILDNQQPQIEDNVDFLPPETITPSDIVEIKKSLKKHFIFSQLAEAEIDCFINELRPCEAEKSTYLFKQGDKSGSYYIILEGSCQIEINGEKKKTLSFGDSFGDLGIIYSAPRSASVFTLTKCYFVEMNRKIFKKVMEKINSLDEEQNKKFLQVLSFYKDLTEDQKNALASTCLTETYDQGQTIFTEGDDANSFYIIKEGVVMIKDKNVELKPSECFGENSIIVEGGKRANTLVAKTKCKVISMSRENIRSSLGGEIKVTMRKNIVWKLLTQSNFYKQNQKLPWKQAFQKVEDISVAKGQIVFQANEQFKNEIYIVLSASLSGENSFYKSNTIVEEAQLTEAKKFVIKENVKAESEGYIAKIRIDMEKKQEEKVARSMKSSTKISQEKKMVIGDFHVVKKLRSGNFGQVYACYNYKTNKTYALKVLDRSYVEKAQIIQYVMNEEEILRTAPSHPFLVHFYKLLKDSNFLYFVMEYIEGEDLFDTITKMINFSESQTRFLVSQILLVLEHLHSHKIIYRDLKPENLMMCTNGYLKMVDLGTSKKLKIQRRYRTTTIIGTPHYMAPEIITGKGYSFHVDLWSMGVIMYELLCGKLPFGEFSEDPFSIYEQIINSSIKYPRNCQKNCKVFIEKLLSRNPQHRMGNGYQELKRHSFFEGTDWKKILEREVQSFYILDNSFKLKQSEIDKAIELQSNKLPDKILSDKARK